MSYLLCTNLKITVSWNVQFIMVNIFFLFVRLTYNFFCFIFKKGYRMRSVLKICILNTILNFLVLPFLKKYLIFDNKFRHISIVTIFMLNYLSAENGVNLKN